VAGNTSNINAVAADATDIGTVAGISANVTTVAGISSDVTTVAADGTDIGTVAGISANVTTVAGISSDVTTVAGISGDVSSVAAQVVGYDFSTTTTMADPGSGNVRFNNATLASVSQIAIDDLDKNGVDQSAYIALFDDSTNTIKGTLVFRTGGGDVATFNITGLTDNSGWSQIAVAHVASSGTFSNGEDTFIGFTRAGDKGADGAGSGDVSGPASATDNALARYDGTGGKTLQNSGVTVDDSGNIAANNLSGTNTGDESAASATASGIVELATSAEVTTGTDTVRAVTPEGLHAGLAGLTDTTITAADAIIFSDATDSGKLKEDTVQGILDLVTSSDQTARDMAASAMTLILANTDANQNGAVGPFWLTDDFESDNLTTKTNATYNAAGDYYHNPGVTSTASAIGQWTGSTGSYTFTGDTIQSVSNDRGIRSSTAFTGDVWVEFIYRNTGRTNKQLGWADNADIGSYNSTSNATNAFGGMGAHACWIYIDASSVVQVRANNTGGSNEASSPVTLADGDTVKLQRNASNNVLLYVNSVLEYTWSATRTGSQNFIIHANDTNTHDMDSFSFNQPGTVANMTLAPTAVTITTANPTDILGYVVVDPQEAITVATDIIMTASIDGGTTDAVGSWTKVGDIGTTELYRVEFDVSAQTGSSLIYEITTANTKEIRYNASVGLVPLY